MIDKDKTLFAVKCWQEATYLVRAENVSEAVKLIDNPVERIGVVGYGAINVNGRVAKPADLPMIEASKPCSTEPIKAA